MTDTGPDHARFEELAAGHALHALDPADERRFLSHAQQCPHCRHALAGYADVTGALAEIAPAAEPSPELGPRIMAAALAGDSRAEPDHAAPVVPLRRHPRPRWLKATAAAAAAAAIAGGTWAGLAASTGTSPPQPLAACRQPSACPEVLLTGISADRTAARVIIAAGTAWLHAGLPADDTARQIYVLWQVTAAHTPVPVGSFDVRPGTDQPIRIGALTASYRGTKAFAVSLEPGRAIPARPSRIVAQGQPADT